MLEDAVAAVTKIGAVPDGISSYQPLGTLVIDFVSKLYIKSFVQSIVADSALL